MRADYAYRDYRDFYSQRIDHDRPARSPIPFGKSSIWRSSRTPNDLQAALLRASPVGDLSLRRAHRHRRQLHAVAAWGNFDGENVASGPLTDRRRSSIRNTARSRGTTRRAISVDQRHRAACGSTTACRRVERSDAQPAAGRSRAACRTAPAASIGGNANGVDAPRTSPTPATPTPQGGDDRDLLLHGARRIPNRRSEADRLRRQLHLQLGAARGSSSCSSRRR